MNLFCCFRKKKNTNVKDSSLETVNVLVTEDRFTEMSTVSDYNKSISFFNREEDDIEINDLIDEMIWHVEIKNLF
jgi:hypothetical protein